VIILRPLTGDDAPARRALRLEALQTDPTAFGADLASESAWPIERWRELPERGAIIGAFDGSALVAMGGVFERHAAPVRHWADLAYMFITPAHRGSGLADRLMSSLIDFARREFAALGLSLTSGNEAALRLYRRHGFAEIGRRPAALRFAGVSYDEILMWRSLVE
jgi:GNAT superfamily N-acetyltransferase